MDLADTDSSVGEVESVEDFEDIPESCNVEDDIFIDNIQSTRIQYLSELILKFNLTYNLLSIYLINFALYLFNSA